jgi:hypothetical protein
LNRDVASRAGEKPSNTFQRTLRPAIIPHLAGDDVQSTGKSLVGADKAPQKPQHENNNRDNTGEIDQNKKSSKYWHSLVLHNLVQVGLLLMA